MISEIEEPRNFCGLNDASSEIKECLLTDYKSDPNSHSGEAKRYSNTDLFKCTEVLPNSRSHAVEGNQCGHNSFSQSFDTFKKKRRTKANSEKRNYACNFCQKSYFSYPALYTHKRNKHNIIPITGKQQIFKSPSDNASVSVKFKYSAIENDNCSLTEFLDFVTPLYVKILNEYFTTPQSALFKANFDYRLHRGYQILHLLREREIQKLEIPKPQDSPIIDDILIIYLVYFSKVARDIQMIEMIARFVILLREHINIVGWDYKKKFVMFGVKVDFQYRGAYTSFNDCQEIPDYMNDFMSVFLDLEGIHFDYEMKDIMDICQNFCNWLFVNNLTNFKVAPNNTPIEGIY